MEATALYLLKLLNKVSRTLSIKATSEMELSSEIRWHKAGLKYWEFNWKASVNNLKRMCFG